MNTTFQLFPDQASSYASRVDGLFAFHLFVAAFFTVLIFLLIAFFALKFRRRSDLDRPAPPHVNPLLEATWIAIPFLITMVMFTWGAALFVHIERPPAGAMRIDVVGKQWMWKLQHPTGRREINELHVPVGRSIVLSMISQDVIHSFYVPAFRVKQDVLPSQYASVWFEPTRVGEYHLFCAEYCGAQHSGMIGRVVVMEPAKYEAWLSESNGDETPVAAGAALFTKYACVTCHGQRGPTLAGTYGRRVQLTDGRIVKADENYLRESILDPSAKIVAGFGPIMPTYRGQLNEEQVMQLIAYIKSLAVENAPATEPAMSR